MTLRKLLIIVFALLILLAVTVGLTSINHPIILKWVTGSARHFGKPISAIVYTNGQLNEDIKVFYTDEPNEYLLSFTEYDSSGLLKFLHINLNEKSIGRPIEMSEDDYDFIGADLFLSERGEQFSPLQDDTKGSDFDPHLSFIDRTIKFNVPPNKLKLDSVRIKLH
jgi:hypothetical protein